MRLMSTWLARGLLIAVSTIPLLAQDGRSIAGPSVGWLLDEEGSRVWPLLGVLGATVPGSPLAFPEGIGGAILSPHDDYAIARSTATGQAVVVRLDISNPVLAPIEGSRTNPELIAISPSGTAAGLFDNQTRTLQLVTGLPSTPRIVYEFDASVLRDQIEEIAVSDDGRLALARTGIESRSLWLIHAAGTSYPLGAASPSHITFLAQRPDALVADDGTHEVFMLQGLDQNPVRSPAIVQRNDGRAFSAIAASNDGQHLFTAQSGSEEVSIVDLGTGEVRIVPCHCSPTGFRPLNGITGKPVFLLNGPTSAEPLTVLDASSETPRTLVIPISPSALARNGREQ